MLTLSEYQIKSRQTAVYPYIGDNIDYPTLKLNGEAGEVAEIVGKLIRKGIYWPGEGKEIPGLYRDQIALELGDVLWYIAAIASELGFDLEKIAEMNYHKLEERRKEGKIDALSRPD